MSKIKCTDFVYTTHYYHSFYHFSGDHSNVSYILFNASKTSRGNHAVI